MLRGRDPRADIAHEGPRFPQELCPAPVLCENSKKRMAIRSVLPWDIAALTPLEEKHEGALGAGTRGDISAADRALMVRLRKVGAVILVAGLLAAVLVYATAPPADPALTSETKRNEYQMEMIGGKSNLLATEIREWFAGLWHGRRLAHTLAYLSIGGSLACFFLAHRLEHFAPRDAG
jgi:hypothetical protein